VAEDQFTSGQSRPGGPEHRDEDEHPCSCINGVHYIGEFVVGDEGEEVEGFKGVPSRRCNATGRSSG
jgi:hypothetical protein